MPFFLILISADAINKLRIFYPLQFSCSVFSKHCLITGVSLVGNRLNTTLQYIYVNIQANTVFVD
jgi:hypothetical protein